MISRARRLRAHRKQNVLSEIINELMMDFLYPVKIHQYIGGREEDSFKRVTTVVHWSDGTSTAVRKSCFMSLDGVISGNDLEAAYCYALAKRLYGSHSKIRKLVKNATVRASEESLSTH